MVCGHVNVHLQVCNDYEATVRAQMHMNQLIAKYLCNKICGHVDDFSFGVVYIINPFVSCNIILRYKYEHKHFIKV